MPDPARSLPGAYLLSVYDEYISVYKRWNLVVDEAVDRQLRAMDNALNYIVVVDGRIVGTWKRTVRKDTVQVELSILNRLTDVQNKSVEVAVQKYGDFLGLPIVAV